MADGQTLLISPEANVERPAVAVGRMSAAVLAILGLVLLFAAAMKAYTPVSESPEKANWLSRPAVILAAIEMEIALSVWLLSGIHRRLAWRAALGCFVVFTGVSAYKGLIGAASCGCFGGLHTNPWYTAAFDVAAVVALLLFPPRGDEPIDSAPSPKRMFSAVAIALACAALGAGTMLSRVPTALAAGELEASGPGSLVLLEPEKWIGQRLPLSRYIQADARWQSGTWLLVLYDADCPVCRKAVPRFAEMAGAGQVNVALIEIPPHQPEAAELTRLCPACVSGSLSEDKDWFATTPVAMLVEDGIVRAAAQGEEVLKVHFDAQSNKLNGFSQGSTGTKDNHRGR
jgi:hypothetical protein